MEKFEWPSAPGMAGLDPAEAVDGFSVPDGLASISHSFERPMQETPKISLDVYTQQPVMLAKEKPAIGTGFSGSPEEWFAFWRAYMESALLRLEKRVNFVPQPFSVGAGNPVGSIRPEEHRSYLLIQNTHATQILYIGFGYVPNAGNGLVLGPGGFYEPLWVPQNEIWIVGSGAGTTGLLLYANKPSGSILAEAESHLSSGAYWNVS